MVRFIDRSRIEEWYRCPRKYYWGYLHDGVGLVPEGPTPVDLCYGLAFHNGAEEIAYGHGLDAALAAAKEQTDRIEGTTLDGLPRKDEYYALAYGHLRAFYQFLWPRVLSRYDLLAVETEMVLPLSDDLVYGTRLDLGVRDKQTRMAYNWEYKTDSNPSDIGERMRYYLQLLLETKCLAEHLGEYVHGTIICGIDKGSKGRATERDRELGKGTCERRLSPFTYYYAKSDTFEDTVSIKYQRGKGWERRPTWLYPGGSEGWFEKLIDLKFDMFGQFAETPPVRYDEDRFQRIKRQIVAMEHRVNEGMFWIKADQDPVICSTPAVRDTETKDIEDYFGQNFQNCLNDGDYKRPCPFVDLCHNAADLDPLGSGYKYRTSNHPVEETINEAFRVLTELDQRRSGEDFDDGDPRSSTGDDSGDRSVDGEAAPDDGEL